MATPPSVFDNHLERWIFDHRIESVVSVEFRPKSGNKVLERWDLLSNVNIPKKSAAFRQRVEDSRSSMFSTGVIVGENEQDVFVLTCAHALGPVFNSNNPIDVPGITELYAPWILCDHREQRFLIREDNERESIEAAFSMLDLANDLLLLQVNKGDFMVYCNRPHDPVIFGNEFPSPFTRVVMLSWPLRRHRTAVRGHISHDSRDIADLAQENPHGFITMLSEVDITSDSGSSGAPLFDACGQGIGLLHGGDGQFSYFIPLDVIRQCFIDWGWEYYMNE